MIRLKTVVAAFLLVAFFAALTGATAAQGLTPSMSQPSAEQPAVTGDPSPNDIRELMRLLSDREMVEWLKNRAAETGQGTSSASVTSYRETVAKLIAGARNRVHDIVTAFASLPEGIETLKNRADEIVPPGRGLRAATYVVIFLFVGAGLEWLFWQYFQPVRLRIEISRPERLAHRFAAAAGRLALAAAAVAVFAVGSIGTFLAFDWPPILEWMIVNLLLGVVVLRAVIALCTFLFAPRISRLRLVPLSEVAARQAYRWVVGTAFVWVGGLLIADAPRRMAVATNSGPGGYATAEAVAGIAGIITSLVVIAAIWRLSPKVRAAEAATGRHGRRLSRYNFAPVVQTVLVILIMVSWFGGIQQVTGTLIIAALVLPLLHLARVLIDHFYDEAERPLALPRRGEPGDTDETVSATQDPLAAVTSDSSESAESGPAAAEPVVDRYDYQRPIVHRLARLLIIIGSILALGAVWGVNILALSSTSTGLGRVAGIAVDISAALLVADLIWTWAKTAIDRRLEETGSIQNDLGPGPEARILTLLPIFRMTLLIVLLTVVGLTLLSSLGVNIAPILAGAGVIGIAVGFGAQALVRDVFSGIFFLLDDAFRVGEYIEMENLRGTVESMSLRSLKVRHHRGAVHTIPFGELKSLTNYSRDWVMMKLEFRVPFDTDIMLVKKIVKRVGAELLANENYGKHIIETLKSQGVRRMEEFNMVVGVKFMTKPGAQWVIRRDAYQKLRDEFDKNGISFAERNVKVQVVSDHPLTEEQKNAAVGAAQNAIEQQIGPEGAAPAPDEP